MARFTRLLLLCRAREIGIARRTKGVSKGTWSRSYAAATDYAGRRASGWGCTFMPCCSQLSEVRGFLFRIIAAQPFTPWMPAMAMARCDVGRRGHWNGGEKEVKCICLPFLLYFVSAEGGKSQENLYGCRFLRMGNSTVVLLDGRLRVSCTKSWLSFCRLNPVNGFAPPMSGVLLQLHVHLHCTHTCNG